MKTPDLSKWKAVQWENTSHGFRFVRYEGPAYGWTQAVLLMVPNDVCVTQTGRREIREALSEAVYGLEQRPQRVSKNIPWF